MSTSEDGVKNQDAKEHNKRMLQKTTDENDNEHDPQNDNAAATETRTLQ